MARILALLATEPRRTIVLASLEHLGEVILCDSTAQLCEPASGLMAVITELADHNGVRVDSALAHLRAHAPSVPIVLYAPLQPANVREALAIAARTGIEEIAFRGIDDLAAVVRHVVAECAAHAAAAEIIRAIDPLVPLALRAFLRQCIWQAPSRPHVTDVVVGANLRRRTLELRLHEGGYPTIEQIIEWSRVLHAAWQLDTTHATVEHIAHDLGLSSAAPLRYLFRRYAGIAPETARAAGAFRLTLSMFVERLRTSNAAFHSTH